MFLVFSGCVLGRHALTGLLATPADIGALLHGCIAPSQSRAVFGALRAHFGADTANLPVKMRRPYQKVCAGRADLRTVEQKANMWGFGVLSAHFQTVGSGLGTDAMAVQAILDASLHLFSHLVRMCHINISFPKNNWGAAAARITCL
jgi:hypothetical protein